MSELPRVFCVSWYEEATKMPKSYYLAVPKGMIFVDNTPFVATEAGPTFSLLLTKKATDLQTGMELFECRLSQGIWTEERKQTIRKEWHSDAKTAWLADFPSQPE